MGKDIGHEPVTQLQVHQHVESLMEGLVENVNKAFAAQKESLTAYTLDALQSYGDALVANINKAIEAVMESKKVELVTGPTSVKRIKRDADGNLETIEEYGTLRP